MKRNSTEFRDGRTSCTDTDGIAPPLMAVLHIFSDHSPVFAIHATCSGTIEAICSPAWSSARSSSK